MFDPAKDATYRKEAKVWQIESPFRVNLYCCARRNGMSPAEALRATKSVDPKVVRWFQAGK